MTLEQIESLGRPLRADAERNRRRILAAAAEVFARRGLDAGLDEIARHAGVGIGTVYRRFPDKPALIDALFQSRIDDVIEMTRTALAMPSAWDGLVHFLVTSTEMQQADRGLKELLFGEGCPGGLRDDAESTFSRKLAEIVPLIGQLVERAKAEGDLRPDFAATDLAMIQFMLHGTGTFCASVDPQLWRRQLGILLDGLRARRDRPTPLPAVPLTLGQLDELCSPRHGPGLRSGAGRSG